MQKRTKLSAKTFSKKIGQHDGYFTKVKAGRILPPLDVLENIVIACDSSFEELFCANFETYKEDQELLRYVKSINNTKLSATITLLSGLYGISEEKKEKN